MGNETTAIKSAELFSFNAKYEISTESVPARLLDDASIFLSSAIEIFITEIETAERECSKNGNPGLGQRLWGAYHLFRMAKGTVDAAKVEG